MKSNHAFTLIELLAVIAILAIILLIAVPQILNTITNVKLAAYNSQVSLIIDAAQKYSASFSSYPAVGQQRVITLKDLQDNNYIGYNLKDARTGNTIPDKSWIIITNNNGKYEYDYGYEAEGLIVQYDSISGDGLGIPNTNTSGNKALWKDLSGNNKDGILNSFDYTTTSGWNSNTLKFDGVNDYVRIPSLGTLNNVTFEMVLLRNTASQITWTSGDDVLIVYSNGNTYLKSNAGILSNGSTFSMSNGITYLLSIVYNIETQKANYYLNGSLVKQVSLPANSTSFNFNNGQNLFADYGSLSSFGYGNIYAVRMYNRALNTTEIQHNYDTDQKRFNF